MNAMIAPDGKPATFNGQAWISQDGKYWWNGAAWQRIGGRRGPNFFVIGMGLVIVAAVSLVITGVIRPAPPPPVVMGVTNPKIDSSSQIELDYATPTTCKQLTFEIVFYDKTGRSLDTYVSDAKFNVTPNVTHHYIFTTFDTILAAAVKLVATPTCTR